MSEKEKRFKVLQIVTAYEQAVGDAFSNESATDPLAGANNPYSPESEEGIAYALGYEHGIAQIPALNATDEGMKNLLNSIEYTAIVQLLKVIALQAPPVGTVVAMTRTAYLGIMARKLLTRFQLAEVSVAETQLALAELDIAENERLVEQLALVLEVNEDTFGFACKLNQNTTKPI